MLTPHHYQTIAEALEAACERHGKRLALIEVERERELVRFTYEDFHRAAKQLSAQFKDKERIAIIMQNQSKWLITAFAAFRADAILVPIDYKLTAQEQCLLLQHASPQCLVTEFHHWQALQPLLAEKFSNLDVIVTNVPDDVQLKDARSWENSINKSSAVNETPLKNEIACLVYSSGTGGMPKGCLLTHQNYLRQASVLIKLFPVSSAMRFFSILPTNHAIDFMCGFLLPMLLGATVIHQRTLRPQYLLATLQHYQITHLAVVPLLLKTFVKRIEEAIAMQPRWQRALTYSLINLNALLTFFRPCYFLSRCLLWPIHKKFGGKLRLLIAGGGFVDENDVKFFYKIGMPVVVGYGLTEACTVVTVNRLRDLRYDTVGKPVPDIAVQLRDQDQTGAGEVWVRGPTIMRGYYQAASLTAEVISNGWLRTGDVGVWGKGGHLKLIGRKKNMIVTAGGKNIYPEDVEMEFESLPGCEEFAVFAKNFILKKYELHDEKLLITLRLAGNANLNNVKEELQKRNQRLVDYKRITYFLICPFEFPRTASMKIKRDELARLIANAIPSLTMVPLY